MYFLYMTNKSDLNDIVSVILDFPVLFEEYESVLVSQFIFPNTVCQ